MIKNNIFFKKKNKKIIIFLNIILFLLALLYFFFLKERSLFFLPQNNNSFYIYPEDKGGLKIKNLNKNSLHLSYNKENILNLDSLINLKYSIQIETNSDYNYIENKRNNLINNNPLFNNNNLYIRFLKNNFSTDYFLLYLNFDSKKLANEYCHKYSSLLEDCIVVNVQNLD